MELRNESHIKRSRPQDSPVCALLRQTSLESGRLLIWKAILNLILLQGQVFQAVLET